MMKRRGVNQSESEPETQSCGAGALDECGSKGVPRTRQAWRLCSILPTLLHQVTPQLSLAPTAAETGEPH